MLLHQQQCVEGGPQYISIVMRVVAILLLVSNCNRMHVPSLYCLFCVLLIYQCIWSNPIRIHYPHEFDFESIFVVVPQRHIKLSPISTCYPFPVIALLQSSSTVPLINTELE